MLGKLLKYELKSTMRTFLPMYGGAILLALISHFSYSLLPDNKIFNIITGLLTTLFVFAMISMIAITAIIIIQRFYKNILGDEGYLMMALPVKTYQHVVSKLLVSAMWLASSIVVLLGSIMLVIPDYKYIPMFFSELREGYNMFVSLLPANVNIGALIAVGIAFLIVVIFMSISYIYFAMSIGHLAPKRKLLCSFGAYLAIDLVVQTVMFSILSMVLSSDISRLNILVNETYTLQDLELSFTQSADFGLKLLFIILMLYAILTVVYNVLSSLILKKKPNLE